MKIVLLWLKNWRRRNPWRYGFDKNKSSWDAEVTGTDLLKVMVDQNKRRVGLPRKGMLP